MPTHPLIRTIPAQTNRAHLKQSNPFCDTVHVLNMAALTRGRWADMNACHCLDGDLNLHWPESMRHNGFTHIIDAKTRKRRPMTHEELTRPIAEWPIRDALRARRRMPNGHWVGPATIRYRTRQARWRRVKIAWELKSAQYAHASVAERFVEQLAGLVNWAVMTLVTMKWWDRKMESFHNAGAPTALLTHGQPRERYAARLEQAGRYIGRYWGRWR